MDAYSPAQPQVKTATVDATITIESYAWAKFYNTGMSDGTIDFGDGNTYTLTASEDLLLVYSGRAYGKTIINAPDTTIKIVFLR